MIAWTMPSLFRSQRPEVKALQTKLDAAYNRLQKLMVRARYDAAQTTSENRKHWAMADGLSARAANSLGIRQTLRNRARYESANNSYCAGMLLTLANDMVGTGPRLQMTTANKPANEIVEREFMAWCKGTSTTGEDLFTSTTTTSSTDDGTTTGDGTSTGGT